MGKLEKRFLLDIVTAMLKGETRIASKHFTVTLSRLELLALKCKLEKQLNKR